MMTNSLHVLFKKDVREYFQSKRIYIILLLVSLVAIISLYSGLSGFDRSSENLEDGLFFLKIFSSSGSGLPSFASFISFLLPLVGITLGFDAINGEKIRGTLSRLMAQPIYRDDIIVSKFLAGMFVLSTMIFILFGMVTGISIITLGIPPTLEEVLRMLVYMMITILMIGIWFALSLGLSIYFKQATVSALTGIFIWIFVMFFMNMLIQGLTNVIYPISNTMDSQQVVNHQKLLINLAMLSPMSLYSNSISAILNPGVRSLGLVFYEQLEGAIVGKLPLLESVMVVMPQLLLMVGMIFILFIVAYLKFIRQEIRST
jgi:ABC-2 type transport system permease protein